MKAPFTHACRGRRKAPIATIECRRPWAAADACGAEEGARYVSAGVGDRDLMIYYGLFWINAYKWNFWFAHRNKQPTECQPIDNTSQINRYWYYRIGTFWTVWEFEIRKLWIVVQKQRHVSFLDSSSCLNSSKIIFKTYINQISESVFSIGWRSVWVELWRQLVEYA